MPPGRCGVPASARVLVPLASLFLLACKVVDAGAAEPASTPSTEQLAPEFELDPDLRAQLRARLEQRLAAHHVPAASFALVVGDHVVALESFGTTRLDGDAAVDPDTRFALASTTKTLTAALAAMAIDEGVIAWDDPVTEHLPWFEVELDGAQPGQSLTLEDMLSHRSGFTRMSMLWIAGEIDREVMLHVAREAEPFAPHRSGFAYNNVMYAAAGDAIAAALGQAWEPLLGARLLEPLGMGRTTVSREQMLGEANFAAGTWHDPQDGTTEAIPMRELSTICPAGCVLSSARDMAQFIRLLLGRGELDGERLISAEAIDSLWQPRVAAGARAYGIGWFIAELDGERLLEHGGNIDGYQSDLRLLPDLELDGARPGVGYVLLTNSSVHGLRGELDSLVLSTLMPERFEALPEPVSPDTASTAPQASVDESLRAALRGEYRTAEGLACEVVSEGAELIVVVPGAPQLAYVAGDAPDQLRGAGNPTAITIARDGERIVGFELSTPSNRYRFERVERPPVTKAQRRRFEAALALDRRAKAQAKLGPLQWSGVARLPNTGIAGTITSVFTAEAMRDEVDFGLFGRTLAITTAAWGWGDTSFSKLDTVDGLYLRQQWLDHPYALVGDLRGFYDELELLGFHEGTDASGPSFEVRGRVGEAPPEILWIDADTGDVIRRELSLVQRAMGTIKVTVVYEDFVESGGLRWPRRVTASDAQRGVSTLERPAPTPTSLAPDTFVAEPFELG